MRGLSTGIGPLEVVLGTLGMLCGKGRVSCADCKLSKATPFSRLTFQIYYLGSFLKIKIKLNTKIQLPCQGGIL